tara:strand:- start:1071 stop:2111 length:1041 start_codon:yes stop_codon:yes gene_type:complete
MSTKGRSIRLFLADGSPSGILTAEIMNWTGHVLYGPRTRLSAFLNRKELQKTGVYLLIGQSDEAVPLPLVYVGESDNVRQRLIQHNSDEKKNFWEFMCVITSKDENLTKAHVKYLESQLIGLVKQEGRAELQNGNQPEYAYLPEAELADMDYFLEQLRVLLPSIGLEFLRPTPVVTRAAEPEPVEDIPPGTPQEENSGRGGAGERSAFGQTRPTADGGESPTFEVVVRKPALRALAVERDGRMVVLEGSEAREHALSSQSATVRAFRDQLRRAGKLVPAGRPDVLRFATDVAFTSPSAAADAIYGTSRNGREDWKIRGTGETYARWQEDQLGVDLAGLDLSDLDLS